MLRKNGKIIGVQTGEMGLNKEGYFSALSTGDKLEMNPVKRLLQGLNSHLSLEPVPSELFRHTKGQSKLTEELTRLPIYIVITKQCLSTYVMTRNLSFIKYIF